MTVLRRGILEFAPDPGFVSADLFKKPQSHEWHYNYGPNFFRELLHVTLPEPCLKHMSNKSNEMAPAIPGSL